ncbi:MAG: hypothetical protein OHK0029_33430 [Armatimonadaceae bacterium]
MTTQATSVSTSILSPRAAQPGWLFSRIADFWLASAGAGLPLLLLLAALHWWGNQELDFADLLLAELHLGATYDAVARRQLWKRLPWDVLVVPALILVGVYALTLTGNRILVFTGLMYMAVWHRGRQNLGLARFYQRFVGGTVSRWHDWLFQGAIYLPMAAGVLFFTAAYPTHYEGEPYFALQAPEWFVGSLGGVALAWVLTYLFWTLGKTEIAPGKVHPAERWLIIAHAIAFGSAYILGAWNAAFIIVLAIHHEISYLYFTYALARKQLPEPPQSARAEFGLAASYAKWPLIGLATALLSMALMNQGEPWLTWVGPSFVGLLLIHYWLDGRIWTRKAGKA